MSDTWRVILIIIGFLIVSHLDRPEDYNGHGLTCEQRTEIIGRMSLP